MVDVHIVEQPLPDPSWDEFLAGQPTGHHVQSSAWGQLKAKFGWQVIRVLVREGDQIIGGTQILARRLPVWGKIGFISKGPVVIDGRADVMEALFDTVEQVAKTHRFLVLSVQPPDEDPVFLRSLDSRQFKPSSFYVVPPVTVLVDLYQSEDQILAQMKKKTRYGIRLASRKGVVIREGNEGDLPQFYQWMKTTAARDPYRYYELAYYREAWRQFAPKDMMKLWIAYYQDEPLAGAMVIAFGEWAVYKWGASSGAHHKRMPNYLLQWTAILWSKERGCHYYDLGGITPSVANVLKRGEKPKPTDSKGAGIAHFKSGFGQVVSFPDSYDNNYCIRPRWLVRKAVLYAGSSEFLRKLVQGARGV